MNDEPGQIDHAAAAIRKQWDRPVRFGIVLGTGLGSLSGQFDVAATFSYDDFPGFPSSTAMGHQGRFVCGELLGTPVMLMDGRCHVYEGYSVAEVTRPIRLMHALGIEILVATNAAGGLNPQFATGDIVAVEDHIDMIGSGIVTSLSDFPRCAATATYYDRLLLQQAIVIARREDVPLHRGVYIAMPGPSYETRAEYRFLRRIGGDVVGMSTVPEVTVASECGMRCLALSIVTNVAKPDVMQRVDPQDVVAVAQQAGDNVLKIVLGLVSCVRDQR